MTEQEIFSKIKKAWEKEPDNADIYRDGLLLCQNENNHEWSKEIRGALTKDLTPEKYEVWKAALKFDAPVDFDAYMIYVELNREKTFYLPRRKQLLPLVKAMQQLEDRDIEILCISLPPRCGKTTLGEFYMTWVAGRNPSDSILMSSHSKALLTDVYGEVLRIIDPKGEYLWYDVFGKKVARTNALDLKIDLGKARRFSNFQFGSVEAQLAGRVNASRLLYCDDLIEGIEEALSRDRLDKKIRQYTVNLEQRREQSKSDGTFARELHIATRWSVNDVIGHIERREAGNPKALFINTPALNENDESNFDYKDGVGFTTETYKKLRGDYEAAGEMVSWNAIYMGEPVEREGLLYNRDELKTYDKLPDGEPDAIVSVVDTKTTGSDFCFMPICYIYGDEFYVEDCVYSDDDETLIENMLANKIAEHKVQIADFESNAAGSVIARNVSNMLKEKNSPCTVKTHFTSKNKETKIVVNAGWVKEHCVFKMSPTGDYAKMMQALCSYSQKGKNKHDDVPDGFAQLSVFAQSRLNAKVVIMDRFF